MKDYQDVEIKGELKRRGRRVCQERWDFVKPYLKPRKTFLDIGSNAGYFSIKIAREIPGSTIASIEKSKEYAIKQKDILTRNNLKNILLCNHEFNLEMIEFLCKYHEAVDVILLFSVVHYYEPEEVQLLLKAVSQLSPEIIIEFPRPEEKSAGLATVNALSPFRETLKKYFENVELIGEPSSYMSSDIKRDIFRARNSYLSRSGDGKHKLSWSKIKGWQLDNKKRDWISGLNFFQFAKWNIIYPKLDWIKDQARSAYSKLRSKNEVLTDISMRNLLFTPEGLQAIDYSDKDTVKLHGQTLDSYCEKDWFEKRLKNLEKQIRQYIHEEV